MQKNAVYPVAEQDQRGIRLVSSHMNVPADSIDVWEIDAHRLLFERKIATGSSGDLWVLVIVRPVICSHTSVFLIEWFNWNRYKGTFCSQDVAIKVLRGEHLDDKLQSEFVQEVSIMRSVIFLVLYRSIWMLTETLSEILKTFAVTAGTYKYTSGIMFIYWHYIQM